LFFGGNVYKELHLVRDAEEYTNFILRKHKSEICTVVKIPN